VQISYALLAGFSGQINFSMWFHIPGPNKQWPCQDEHLAIRLGSTFNVSPYPKEATRLAQNLHLSLHGEVLG
jgi:hypothetical protein